MQMLEAIDICRERNNDGIVVFYERRGESFCSGGDQNVKSVQSVILEMMGFKA